MRFLSYVNIWTSYDGSLAMLSKIGIFSTSRVCIKNIHCSELKLLPAYFPSNSEQNDEYFRNIYRIFVTYSILEGNDATLIEKNPPRANWINGLIDTGTVKRSYKQV